MKNAEKYMQRCLDLAQLGIGNTAPNPLVGSVIVHNNGKIIGEGYHQEFGEAHAEVNAINSVKDKSLLKSSTMYINLEPCSHFGKTPPCADLIVENNIPRVVIGCIDSSLTVGGKGVEKLTKAGCDVIVGVLEKESRELNRRFFTFHEKKRPYIILKWAQTLDGYIALVRKNNSDKPLWITNELARTVVHKWRAEEQAIMVGTNTAEKDNPVLNVRDFSGNNPLRIVLDRKMRLPDNLHLFDGSIPTLIFTEKDTRSKNNLEYVKINFNKNVLKQLLNVLYEKEIQSVIIEGGEKLLGSFINQNLWDEARVFIGNKFFYNGIKAPQINGKLITEDNLGDSKLFVYRKE